MFGWMTQDVKVLPGSVLRLNWSPNPATGFFPGEWPFTVIFENPLTGQQLSSFPMPNSTGSPRLSEFDLTRYAGQDLRIKLMTRTKDPLIGINFGICQNATWFDNVSIQQRAINSSAANPIPGLWYNPSRSGSGWDLRRAPSDGSFYAIWYTFEGGEPVWYFVQQVLPVNGALEGSITRWTRSGSVATPTTVGRAKFQMLNGAAYGTDNQAALMSFDFINIPNPAGSQWDSTEWYELLAPGGVRAYNGSFTASNPQDPNWGITITTYPWANPTDIFMPIYYYKPSGQPTWVVAQQGFTNGATLNVSRLTGGLCPWCSGYTPALNRQWAGTARLNYPSSNAPSIFAEFNLDNWVRPSREFWRLSF
jgi:hypothetical protein